MDLFTWVETECDHLPVRQRVFVGEWLVCGRCGARLRAKTFVGE